MSNKIEKSQIKPSRKIRKIRDIVHDYISITSIEDSLINSKEFQRLRYICQNSLAYYTYPSNTTNRFAHSLGVMHIGGQLFTKAIENSNKDDLLSFLKECKDLIKVVCDSSHEFEELASDWINLYGNISNFNHLPIDLSEPNWLDKNDLATINILWQSIRIACMIHDIGHFPFSHLFEHAIEDFTNKVTTDNTFGEFIKKDIQNRRSQYRDYYRRLPILEGLQQHAEEPKLHEIQGVLVLKDFVPLRDETDPKKRDLAIICLKIGKAIFIHNRSNKKSDISEDQKNNILDSLHAIVSSEVDADRLDYCMRDPIASGIELGAYDVKRIIDSVVLIKTKQDSYKIVFTLNGISGIESFFHQRFLMYEYLIFHHNVARFDSTLEHVIGLVLDLFTESEIIKEEVLSSGFVQEKPDGRFEILNKFKFCHYDDFWLKTLLNRIYIRLEEKFGDAVPLKQSKECELFLCLKIVLFRNNNHIISIWKRYDDMQRGMENIIEKVNSRTNSSLKLEDILPILNTLIDPKNTQARARIKTIREQLKKKNLTLIIKKIRKVIFADDNSKRVEIVRSNGDLKPAYQVSPYLNSLKHNVEKSIGFNLFVIGHNIKNDKNIKDYTHKILSENLVEYILINK